VKTLFVNNLKHAGKVKGALGAGITGGINARADLGDGLLVGATLALVGAVVSKSTERIKYSLSDYTKTECKSNYKKYMKNLNMTLGIKNYAKNTTMILMLILLFNFLRRR